MLLLCISKSVTENEHPIYRTTKLTKHASQYIKSIYGQPIYKYDKLYNRKHVYGYRYGQAYGQAHGKQQF